MCLLCLTVMSSVGSGSDGKIDVKTVVDTVKSEAF